MVKSRRVVSYLSRIPITRLYPRRTFFRRSFQKFLVLYGERFGLVGSIPVSSTQTGNRVLRLKYSSALGVKGFEFEIPEDSAMYSHVRKAGSWETLSSHFLAEGLKEIEKIGFKKSALVDLGANVGLVTLQTQNYAQTRNSIIMVEPIPNHITAIESNTNHLHKSNEVYIYNYALAKQSGAANIFTERGNHGNTSLLDSASAKENRFETKIRLESARDFFVDKLLNFDHLVLKSDLQGMDASVLAEMPYEIWSKIDRAVVEIWALPEVHRQDVEKVVEEHLRFHQFGWTPKSIGRLSRSELISFWLMKSRDTKDLYIKLA